VEGFHHDRLIIFSNSSWCLMVWWFHEFLAGEF